MPRKILPSLLPPLFSIALVACGNSAVKPSTDTDASPAAKPAAKSDAMAEKPAPKKEPALAAKPAGKTDSAPADMPAKDSGSAKPVEAASTQTSADDKAMADKAGMADKTGASDTASADDAALKTMREFIATKKFDKTAKDWKSTVTVPPKLTFDPARKYFWLLNTTEGPIKIRLMPDVAPMHVSSTIYLTEIGFYDDLTFHRVIPGFMAQGGDPVGNGTGGPAYKYEGEFSPNAKHTKAGILSMANAGPKTDGSQFFLTFVPTASLDGRHTVFGEVVEGLDNLSKLEKFGSPGGKTSKPLKIETAKILAE